MPVSNWNHIERSNNLSSASICWSNTSNQLNNLNESDRLTHSHQMPLDVNELLYNINQQLISASDINNNANGNDQQSLDTNHHNSDQILPLPDGWERAYDPECQKYYFVNHITKQTQWFDPRDVYIKPATFADCIGDELPVGWEQVHHPILGTYFINHQKKVNQLDDPRIEWITIQANMVIGYLEEASNSNQSQSLIHNQIQNGQMLCNSKQVAFMEPIVEDDSSMKHESDYMNHDDLVNMTKQIDVNQCQPSLLLIDDGQPLYATSDIINNYQRLALKYDNNSDYALVIDSNSLKLERKNNPPPIPESLPPATTSLQSLAAVNNSLLILNQQNMTNSMQSIQTAYSFGGFALKSWPSCQGKQQQSRSSNNLFNIPLSSTSSTNNSNKSSNENHYQNRTLLLQKSLLEAKKRVEQLKKELTNVASVNHTNDHYANTSMIVQHQMKLKLQRQQQQEEERKNECQNNIRTIAIPTLHRISSAQHRSKTKSSSISDGNYNHLLQIIDKYYNNKDGNMNAIEV